MKRILFTICTLCIYLPHTTAHASVSCTPVTCCGQITDEYGEPLVGANVIIQASPTGTTTHAYLGAVTDSDGRFIIYQCSDFLNSVSNGSGYLRATAIGFVPYETKMTAGTPVYGTLYEDGATDDNTDCSNNEYREYDFLENASTCETCPTHNNAAATHTTNNSGNPFYTIYNCYIPSGTSWTFSDDAGSGTEKFQSDCYYTMY